MRMKMAVVAGLDSNFQINALKSILSLKPMRTLPHTLPHTFVHISVVGFSF